MRPLAFLAFLVIGGTLVAQGVAEPTTIAGLKIERITDRYPNGNPKLAELTAPQNLVLQGVTYPISGVVYFFQSLVQGQSVVWSATLKAPIEAVVHGRKLNLDKGVLEFYQNGKLWAAKLRGSPTITVADEPYKKVDGIRFHQDGSPKKLSLAKPKFLVLFGHKLKVDRVWFWEDGGVSIVGSKKANAITLGAKTYRATSVQFGFKQESNVVSLDLEPAQQIAVGNNTFAATDVWFGADYSKFSMARPASAVELIVGGNRYTFAAREWLYFHDNGVLEGGQLNDGDWINFNRDGKPKK